jgi:hypothetical protein
VIYLPYDLGYVVSDTQCGGNPTGEFRGIRSRVLLDVLLSCGFAIDPQIVDVPEAGRFVVRQNAPNPFNPVTRIEYAMPADGTLSIVVYNVRGERVRVLQDGAVKAGPGFVVWDGTDDSGAAVSSGVYFYRTVVNGRTQGVHKMALVR